MQLIPAAITGRRHRLFQQNGQDAAYTGQPAGGWAIGVVADGCGSKYCGPNGASASHNEVGAALLTGFAGRWLPARLAARLAGDGDKESGGGDLELLLQVELAAAATGFLRQVVDAQPWVDEEARRIFVATHLLATLVGFVVTPAMACFFWCGDGWLVENGAVQRLESDNRPDYLAYGLLPEMPAPTIHTRPLPRAGLRWLAVASDGWGEADLAALAAPLPPLLRQRWLNRQAKQPGRFDDDGAVALAYLTETEAQTETKIEPAQLFCAGPVSVSVMEGASCPRS